MSKEITKEIYPIYKDARAWLVERREKFIQDCEYYAKQGYRPHYCLHGVNMWVDYDCACAECELDERSDIEIARDMAHSAYRYQKVSA
jgi:hypothetical protein